MGGGSWKPTYRGRKGRGDHGSQGWEVMSQRHTRTPGARRGKEADDPAGGASPAVTGLHPHETSAGSLACGTPGELTWATLSLQHVLLHTVSRGDEQRW